MACVDILEEKYNGKIEKNLKNTRNYFHYDLRAPMFKDNV